MADGTFAVLFDDGDKEPKAKPENLRPLGALASSGAADGLVAGAKVEAKFGGKGKFYPGTIEAANSDGTFAILFDDGDKEPSAKPEHIKLVGARSRHRRRRRRRRQPPRHHRPAALCR